MTSERISISPRTGVEPMSTSSCKTHLKHRSRWHANQRVPWARIAVRRCRSKDEWPVACAGGETERDVAASENRGSRQAALAVGDRSDFPAIRQPNQRDPLRWTACAAARGRRFEPRHPGPTSWRGCLSRLDVQVITHPHDNPGIAKPSDDRTVGSVLGGAKIHCRIVGVIIEMEYQSVLAGVVVVTLVTTIVFSVQRLEGVDQARPVDILRIDFAFPAFKTMRSLAKLVLDRLVELSFALVRSAGQSQRRKPFEQILGDAEFLKRPFHLGREIRSILHFTSAEHHIACEAGLELVGIAFEFVPPAAMEDGVAILADSGLRRMEASAVQPGGGRSGRRS